ncbi:MAG: MarR family transcriptional regulator [Lachnospiraceae bacterium]|nr:MarR family transcriptional regulator [Lachnospiraceae bacterium]
MEIKFRELNSLMEGTDVLYHRAAKSLGISDAELYIYYSLLERGGACPQRDLYKETGISRSTVNSAVKRMEKDGCLRINAIDGRSTRAELTPEGSRRAMKTAGRIIEIENAIYESFPVEDIRKMIELNRIFMERFAAEVKKL